MSRPIYESEGDRQREAVAARQVAEHCALSAVSMPKMWAFDYALVNRAGTIKVILEVKCRTHEKATFGTYILSARKLTELLEVTRSSPVVALLAVQWTDCLGVLRLPADHHLKMGGRIDRGDERDREPVAHFENRLFTII